MLVIIGLLLGGILKGQEMITQAKIKNIIADFSGISAAYYGYQDRYRAIPGDDRTPRRAGPGRRLPASGQRQRRRRRHLQHAPTPPTSRCIWWDHLRRAGFVAGNGAQQPSNAFAGQIGVQTGDGARRRSARRCSTRRWQRLLGLIMCSANLPDKIAIAVDTQMDDGKARPARCAQGCGNPNIRRALREDYTEDGVNTYVVCRPM